MFPIIIKNYLETVANI